MQSFSSSDVLVLWERGARLHPLDRSLLALSAALPAAAEDFADWSLGRRNRALFELHAACFGTMLQGWSECPACGEKAEFELEDRQLLAASTAAQPGTTVTIRGGSFRLPTSRDLAEMLADDPDAAARSLLERCRVGDAGPEEWSNAALSEAGDALAAADPLAEVQLALDCPACGDQWNDVLDIGCFVWAEVESRARRLLWEVHTLASAYGWSEAESLGLSALRRGAYLAMVQA
jgi:hypothetical protein